jgi:acyl-ACP thioesterase
MEFDAIARFLQDAGNDDTDDAQLPELGLAWIARRAVFEVFSAARPRELLSIRTWCSGTGSRWAERRTELTGDHGARIEAVMLWVHVDVTTGRPKAWGEEFASRYLEAAGDRQVDAKLRHPKHAPAPADDGINTMSFTFRQSDMDGFGHVNNAAYLAILEESLGGHTPGQPFRVEVEWRKPSVAGEELLVLEQRTGAGLLGWVTSGDEVRATYAARQLTD